MNRELFTPMKCKVIHIKSYFLSILSTKVIFKICEGLEKRMEGFFPDLSFSFSTGKTGHLGSCKIFIHEIFFFWNGHGVNHSKCTARQVFNAAIMP